MSIAFQLVNRIIGIVVWVSMWNVLNSLIDSNNMVVNGVTAGVGLIMWGVFGEYSMNARSNKLEPV